MRIVAGRWRGRVIEAPQDSGVRPTGDRVREAWMSIVQPRLPGSRVLDLCAGSGALGLEALSRGAVHADFVDASAESLRVVETNARTLGAAAMIGLHRADALAFAAALPVDAYDVAFADPPYRAAIASELALLWSRVPFARLLGVEHESGAKMPAGGRVRRYGMSAITFYERSQ